MEISVKAGKVFLGWNKQRAQGLKVLLAQGLAPYIVVALEVQKSRRPFGSPTSSQRLFALIIIANRGFHHNVFAFIRLFLFEAGGCPARSHRMDFPGGKLQRLAIHSHFINFFCDGEFCFFSIIHHNG